MFCNLPDSLGQIAPVVHMVLQTASLMTQMPYLSVEDILMIVSVFAKLLHSHPLIVVLD
jgi:hypothetical protein